MSRMAFSSAARVSGGAGGGVVGLPSAQDPGHLGQAQLLVLLVQRFRRLDRNARWYSVSRISIELLPALFTPATKLPALGLGRPFARAG